jgi:hypothetical protein
MFCGDGHYFVHFAGVAVEMNGYYTSGFGSYGRFDFVGVYVEIVSYVDENRFCAALDYGAHRGHESVGYGDHFVSGLKKRLSQKIQRVGSGIYASGVLNTQIFGDVFFKVLHVGAKYEIALGHYFFKNSVELFF